MTNKILCAAACASVVLLFVVAGQGQVSGRVPSAADEKVEFSEKSIVKVASPLEAISLVISPDGTRVAYKKKLAGDKWTLVVDGKEGDAYDSQVRALLDKPGFSPDSKRVAFTGLRGKGEFAVVDGKEGEAYEQIATSGPVFSPDSKRFAYAAMRGGKWYLVVDGVRGKAHDEITLGSCVFSSDSKHIAYAAKQDGKEFVIVDDHEGKKYNQILPTIVLSSDGKRVFYEAFFNDCWHAVVDGKEYAVSGGEALATSPDGTRAAWRSYQDGQRITVDGVPGKPYDDAGYIVFSPNGRHVAYSAKRSGRFFMVVDGKEEKAWTGIGYGTYAFSGDGRVLAYAALDGGWHVVLDGKASKSYDEIGPKTVVLNQDGSHVAYWARKGKDWFLVVDGVESRPVVGFLQETRPVFDPSGVVWAIALRDTELLMIATKLPASAPATRPASEKPAWTVTKAILSDVAVDGTGQIRHLNVNSVKLDLTTEKFLMVIVKFPSPAKDKPIAMFAVAGKDSASVSPHAWIDGADVRRDLTPKRGNKPNPLLDQIKDQAGRKFCEDLIAGRFVSTPGEACIIFMGEWTSMSGLTLKGPGGSQRLGAPGKR